jgi:hypothetical protein
MFKENIINMAATYLGKSMKFVMARRLFKEEIDKGTDDKKVLGKKKLFLRDVVYERLDYKKVLKRYIQ